MQARVKFHVMVTTYEVAGFEESELRRISWAALIVDEGHRLKNRNSRLFKVLLYPCCPYRPSQGPA